MNVQPKPSQIPATDRMHGERQSALQPSDPQPRGRVPVAGPRLFYTWPVKFEVEPWKP